jgi:hypothetical protein
MVVGQAALGQAPGCFSGLGRGEEPFVQGEHDLLPKEFQCGECMSTVFCFWSQPDNDPISEVVDVGHSVHLLVSFRDIVLVDTYGVDPERPILVLISEVP